MALLVLYISPRGSYCCFSIAMVLHTTYEMPVDKNVFTSFEAMNETVIKKRWTKVFVNF